MFRWLTRLHHTRLTRLWRVSWRVVLLQIAPSSHSNSHSSHFSGRLLIWVSLCLARELLCIQQYSHSSQLNGRSPLWEGINSNDWPSKIGQGHRVQFSQWRVSKANVKIYKCQFFTFLYIFAKLWSVRTMQHTYTQTDRHTDRQTHRQTDTQTDRHTDRQTDTNTQKRTSHKHGRNLAKKGFA